jgi:hypothetical protein
MAGDRASSGFDGCEEGILSLEAEHVDFKTRKLVSLGAGGVR